MLEPNFWMYILGWFTNCQNWLASSCTVSLLDKKVGYKEMMSLDLRYEKRLVSSCMVNLFPPGVLLAPVSTPLLDRI